jgi:hypothetical protein
MEQKHVQSLGFGNKAQKTLLTTLIGASSFLTAPSAFGLIDTQILTGKRWYNFEVDDQPSKNVNATSIDLAVHVDPIPLIPVAIGVGISSISPSADDLGGSATSMLQMGLDVQAWIPLIPVITPYVRFRYPFMGELKITDSSEGEGKTKEGTYKLTGPAFDAGVKFSVLPFVKLLVQVGQSMDSIEISDYRINGVKQANPGSGQAHGTSALVGLEVGI